MFKFINKMKACINSPNWTAFLRTNTDTMYIIYNRIGLLIKIPKTISILAFSRLYIKLPS